jgi:dihydroorotase
MPNTRPANDRAAVTEAILARAAEARAARVYPAAAATLGRRGEALTDFRALRRAGAVAFTDDGANIADARVLGRALEAAATASALLMDHAVDASLAPGWVVAEGAVSRRLGLAGLPAFAEDLAVARDVLVAERLGLGVHIQHVSSRGTVEILRAAKARGVRVTAEAAPHHLVGTDELVADQGTAAKVAPPLRAAEDRRALRTALAEGIVDVIASDHAPHAAAEKAAGWPEAPFGISGLEAALPLALELVWDGDLSPLRLVEAMSTSPAAILRVAGGSLAVGSPADVTIIDPAARHVIEPSAWISRGKNTPFAGRTVRGRAVATFVDGREVCTRIR